MVKGLIFALVGGVLGAALWAGITYATGYEVGLVAWGIGALVGGGMALGARDERNVMTGVVAAAVALCAIAGGRYAAIYFLVENHLATEMKEALGPIPDDALKTNIADAVVAEFEAAGKTVAWKDGMTIDEASAESDYPGDVWKEAMKRWDAMPAEEKEAMRVSTAAARDEVMKMVSADLKDEMFVSSIGIWDIVFAGLALVSAFKLGGDFGEDASAS